MTNVTITNQTKGKLPRLPFARMKDAVLGERYELSLVFVNSKTSKRLNRIYRDKNKPTNVLSFPISKTEGEIFIDPKQSRADAPRFERPSGNFIAFLFIHALFHLKGFTHGSRMESKERIMRKKFGV